MGEIADMMLDGTMDSETGEWNFDGADGPGFPMTGAEARTFNHKPTAPRTEDAARLRRREKRKRQRRNKAARLNAALADAAKATRNAEPIHRRDGDEG